MFLIKHNICQLTCRPKTPHLILPNRTQAHSPPITWTGSISNKKDNSVELAAYQQKVNIFAAKAD